MIFIIGFILGTFAGSIATSCVAVKRIMESDQYAHMAEVRALTHFKKIMAIDRILKDIKETNDNKEKDSLLKNIREILDRKEN